MPGPDAGSSCPPAASSSSATTGTTPSTAATGGPCQTNGSSAARAWCSGRPSRPCLAVYSAPSISYTHRYGGRMRFSRRERGEGQFGCIVGLILLAIAVFVAYKMIPVKVRAAELRQEIVDEAKAAGTHSDQRIHDAIINKARENNLPVTDESITITRAHSEITVDVEYEVPIEFPGFTYKWKQHHHAQNPIF